MWLSIEPDFKTKRISCRQQLKITPLQELEKIELDCAYNDNHKIDIDSIFYSDAVPMRTENYHLNNPTTSYQ